MTRLRKWIKHWMSWNYHNYTWKQVKKHIHHDLTLVQEGSVCITLECLTCSVHLDSYWDNKTINEDDDDDYEEEEEEYV